MLECVGLNVKLQVSSINAGPSQEVFSFCMGGTSGNLVEGKEENQRDYK